MLDYSEMSKQTNSELLTDCINRIYDSRVDLPDVTIGLEDLLERIFKEEYIKSKKVNVRVPEWFDKWYKKLKTVSHELNRIILAIATSTTLNNEHINNRGLTEEQAVWIKEHFKLCVEAVLYGYEVGEIEYVAKIKLHWNIDCAHNPVFIVPGALDRNQGTYSCDCCDLSYEGYPLTIKEWLKCGITKENAELIEFWR